MTLNTEQILAMFPHPTLTKIVGEPALESLTLMQEEHNSNLASVKTNLGDGTTGLMVISMKPSTFATVHPDPFIIPVNPGAQPNPDEISAASSATKIADIYKAFELKSEFFSEYCDAEHVSVKITIDAVEKIYYQSLKHPHMGYAQVTLRQILDHLVKTYANIDPFDLKTNQEKMSQPYNANAPIETLFRQITEGVSFAELGNAPFTKKQIVDTAILYVTKAGVFQDDLKDWNKQDPANRT